MAQVAEAANTFEGVAREWIAKKKPAWTAYYMRQVERFLEADAFPYIGNLPIRSVTAAHLLGIVRRVEERGAGNGSAAGAAVVLCHLPLRGGNLAG